MIDDCLQRASKVEVRPSFVVDLMTLRMEHFLKAKDLAGCRTTAAMWDNSGRTDAESHYNTACAHALVTLLIRDRDSSSEGEKQSNDEADRAMDWLRKSIAAGYRNVAHMSKDTDLDVLRNRPDFIKLMAAMVAPPPKNEN